VRIVPVIDLLDGRAVRGQGGDRRRYGPVTSRLRVAAGEDLSDPAELLSAYLQTLRPDTVSWTRRRRSVSWSTEGTRRLAP
jgi:uncharacterized protein related to proFAR isomerase